jgi:hypothetical protein
LVGGTASASARWFYGKTRGEVQSALRRVQDRVDAGLTPPSERLTVGAFLNEWAERTPPGTVSERTEDIYRNILGLYLIPALGGVRLAKLTPAKSPECSASGLITPIQGKPVPVRFGSSPHT